MEFGAAVDIVRQRARSRQGVIVGKLFTPWHAMGLESWLEAARSRGDGRHAVVLVERAPRVGHVVKASHLPFADGDSNTTVIHVEDRRAWVASKPRLLAGAQAIAGYAALGLQSSSKQGPLSRQLTLLSPKYPDVSAALDIGKRLAGASLTYVILDEGLGTYLRSMSRVGQSPPPEGPRLQRLARQVRAFLLQRTTINTSHLLFSGISQEGSLCVNAPAASIYAEYVRRHLIKPSVTTACEDGACALVVTQPFSEMGLVSVEDELKVVESVVVSYRSKGYRVLLKPHPTEPAGKWDRLKRARGNARVEILNDASTAVEAFAPSLGIAGVISGCTSAALLTTSVLFGTTAHTFGHWLAGMPSAAPALVSMYERFRLLSSPYVSELH